LSKRARRIVSAGTIFAKLGTNNPGEWISMRFLIFATAMLALVAATAAEAQTLTGEAARKSPQADAFLAYEHALIEGGLEAAIPYMTPAKLADLKGMAEMFGEDGFNQFLDRMRGGAQGEARRRQIMSVAIDGGHAVLEARDDPNTVTEQHLDRTKEGWKVSVRP